MAHSRTVVKNEAGKLIRASSGSELGSEAYTLRRETSIFSGDEIQHDLEQHHILAASQHVCARLRDRAVAVFTGSADRAFNDNLSCDPDVPSWSLFAIPAATHFKRMPLLTSPIFSCLFRAKIHQKMIFVGTVVSLLMKFYQRVILAGLSDSGAPTCVYLTIGLIGPLATIMTTFLYYHLTNKELFFLQLKTFDAVVVIGNWMKAVVALQALHLSQSAPAGWAPWVISGASIVDNLSIALLVGTADAARAKLRTKLFALLLISAYWFAVYLRTSVEDTQPTSTDDPSFVGEATEYDVNQVCLPRLGIQCSTLKAGVLSGALNTSLFLMKSCWAYFCGYPLAIIRPRYTHIDPQECRTRASKLNSKPINCNKSSLREVSINSDYGHQREDHGEDPCTFMEPCTPSSSASISKEPCTPRSEQDYEAHQFKVPKTEDPVALDLKMADEPELRPESSEPCTSDIGTSQNSSEETLRTDTRDCRPECKLVRWNTNTSLASTSASSAPDRKLNSETVQFNISKTAVGQDVKVTEETYREASEIITNENGISWMSSKEALESDTGGGRPEGKLVNENSNTDLAMTLVSCNPFRKSFEAQLGTPLTDCSAVSTNIQLNALDRVRQKIAALNDDAELLEQMIGRNLDKDSEFHALEKVKLDADCMVKQARLDYLHSVLERVCDDDDASACSSGDHIVDAQVTKL